MFYGSPLRSGYGSLDALFSTANIAPNAARYFTWMWQSHTPAWLLALAAPFVLPGSLTALLLSLAAVNVACYLPYAVFNDWWYLRFLLPAIAIVIVLTTAVDRRHCGADLGESTSRGPEVVRAAVVGVVTLVICLLFIREARARSAFDLHRLESRYERAGVYVAGHLPPNALVITSWESGSVRFYGHRKTLVWDALDPAWLDRAIAYSRARGLEPFLLFERWEEPQLPAALCWKRDRDARLAARGRNCRASPNLSAGRSTEVSRAGTASPRITHAERERHVSRKAFVSGYRRSRPKLLRVIFTPGGACRRLYSAE